MNIIKELSDLQQSLNPVLNDAAQGHFNTFITRSLSDLSPDRTFVSLYALDGDGTKNSIQKPGMTWDIIVGGTRHLHIAL